MTTDPRVERMLAQARFIQRYALVWVAINVLALAATVVLVVTLGSALVNELNQ